MTNQNIRARNRKTGEIVEVTRIEKLSGNKESK